ncbi:MAG: ABC transporter permease [Hyphomicrobiales bacterium]|nr:ABC transporter permease [Hyphomicrobiales bacterium]
MTDGTQTYVPPESGLARAWHWLSAHPSLLPVILSIVMAIVFALTVPKFADMRNVLNIFGQLGFLGFLCIGMTFVMVTGGIDLSSYTVVSAAAVVGATVMIATENTLTGCAVMLLIGIAFGAVNGIAVAYLRMIPFIVTLSTMVLAEGFAIWFTQAQSVYGLPDAFIDTFSARVFSISLPWIPRPFGLPVPGLLILAVAILMGFILSRTIYGRRIYLVGANEQTARISGIKVRRIEFSAYVIAGIMAGITAMILTADLGTATTAMVRDVRLMDIIAATVIGGASLRGGKGSILGTMFGLLFLTMLSNAFNLLGVSPFTAMVIKGAVLVAVIGLDVLRSK